MAKSTTPQTCSIHQVEMVMKSIRVRYGSVRQSLKVSPEYLASKREQFPNCNDVILESSTERKARTRRKPVCHACCVSRNAWLVQYHASWPESDEPDGE